MWGMFNMFVDRFYIALVSALEQTHCTLVAYVTLNEWLPLLTAGCDYPPKWYCCTAVWFVQLTAEHARTHICGFARSDVIWLYGVHRTRGDSSNWERRQPRKNQTALQLRMQSFLSQFIIVFYVAPVSIPIYCYSKQFEPDRKCNRFEHTSMPQKITTSHV